MHSSMWKLTALAGVVGIASLVIFQAQRNLNIAGAASVESQDDDAVNADTDDSEPASRKGKDWEEPPGLVSADDADGDEPRPIRKRRGSKSAQADPFNDEPSARADAGSRRTREKSRRADAERELEAEDRLEKSSREDVFEDDSEPARSDPPKRLAVEVAEGANRTPRKDSRRPSGRVIERAEEPESDAGFDPFESEKEKPAVKIEEEVQIAEALPRLEDPAEAPVNPVVRPKPRAELAIEARTDEDTVEVPGAPSKTAPPRVREQEIVVAEPAAENEPQSVADEIPNELRNPAEGLLPRAVITSPHNEPDAVETPPTTHLAPGARLVPPAADEPRPAARPQQKPQLTIEKQAPPNAVLGQPLVYKIFVRNVGLIPAKQVVVEDVIPDGTQLTGTIPRAEQSGKRLIWKIGTLQPNDEKLIKVRIVPKSEGEIGSIATVNFVSDSAAQPRVVAPKLELEVNGPPRVKMGDSFAVNFKISNVGTTDAAKVLLRDLIPEGLQHPGGNDLENDLGAIPAGQSREIELTLTAIKPGAALNRTFVTSEGGVSIEKQLQFEIVGPQLTINRKGPQRLYLNRTAVFSNTIANESQQPFAALTIIENVPEGFQFVQASPPAEYDPARRTLAWKLPQLGPGANVNLKVSLMPKAKGVHSTAIRLFASGKEHVIGKFDARIEGLPAVAVEVPEMGIPFAVGERITYQVRVVNRGSDRATRTALTIVIPEELRLVKAEGPVPFRHADNQLQFEPIPQLEMDGIANFKIEFDAVTVGDARLQIQMQADHLQKPVTREESITLIDGQE